MIGPTQRSLIDGIYFPFLLEFSSANVQSGRNVIIQSEYYFSDRGKAMAELGALLGVDSRSLADFSTSQEGKATFIANKNRMSDDKRGQMTIKDKELLECFYRPFNNALREHLRIMKQRTFTLIPNDIDQWDWLS